MAKALTYLEQKAREEQLALGQNPDAPTPFSTIIKRELGPDTLAEWTGSAPAATTATATPEFVFPQLAATQPFDINSLLQSIGLLSPQVAQQIGGAGLLAPAAEVGRGEFGKPPEEWSGWADMTNAELENLAKQGGTLGQGMSGIQRFALGLGGNVGMGLLNLISGKAAQYKLKDRLELRDQATFGGRGQFADPSDPYGAINPEGDWYEGYGGGIEEFYEGGGDFPGEFDTTGQG